MTNKLVSVGVVGASWWADAMHLPALDSHPRARTVAICGRNRDNAQKMADTWGIPQVYTDYAEMIEDADLDAIVISTPNNSHYPITMKAFERGLHVLCEKPIAMTYAQAREMA
ncbi:MAG: Gfo/Idh/MocA family oxidoreductase, partial [Anaerolineae bacterium]|nr:Gfo/Idh/MocA family oxidoreductase [Anaerolineae bacterium]